MGETEGLYEKVTAILNIDILSSTTLQQWIFSAKHPCSIVDARPYADYMAGHIPGAIWMNWEAWCESAPAHAGSDLRQPGYWGVLAENPHDRIEQRLAQAGLSSDSPIVVYADGPRSKGREGRIAWMLLYYGACSVSLLDGGWSSWLSAGGTVETPVYEPTPGRFEVHIQPQRRVLLSQLKQAYGIGRMPLLVDTRSRAEYEGELYDYQPRKGHISGAVHVPYTDFFDEAGYFVERDRYLQRLPLAVRQAESIAACCEVGVRSALFALLHEYYTGKVVANFDGSFMEWGLDETLPVESAI